jgi:hypothetical protein
MGANALGTLHSLIEFAIDEGWSTRENPVKCVEKPALATTDPDVHFFDAEEVEALLRAVPDDRLGRVELELAVPGLAIQAARSVAIIGG